MGGVVPDYSDFRKNAQNHGFPFTNRGMRTSGGVGSRGLRQKRVQRYRIARVAQFLRRLGVAQHARDAGQCFQVIGARRFRREQQKNEIDRFGIERVKIDRALQPGKQAEQAADLGKLAVRDSDAVADAGRAPGQPQAA